MKIKLDELRRVIAREVNEARKKARRPRALPQKDEAARPVLPRGYERNPQNDLSKPQGEANRYRRQGRANFGPLTSEQKLRAVIRGMVAEAMSAFRAIHEPKKR